MNKDKTTIQISHETLELLKRNLGYKKKNNKLHLETYNDLLKRILK